MPDVLRGNSLLTQIQRDCLSLLAPMPDQDQFYLVRGAALGGPAPITRRADIMVPATQPAPSPRDEQMCALGRLEESNP